MKRPCNCHGPDYPHLLREFDWCCGEKEIFDDDDAAREASRSIDRENAIDINRANRRFRGEI